jgi:hypothetical protein
VTTASLASREGGAAASFGPVRSRTPCGAPVLGDQGPDRPAGHGKVDPCPKYRDSGKQVQVRLPA